ncbi:unnamed protein product [Cuscuta epithymum]|nr:unnamed protein product [Cuscuta epithymum]
MTGDSSWFKTLISKDGGNVTLGDKTKKKVIGKGQVSISDSTTIKDVLLVDGLKYNLLSISQLCDDGHKVVFNSNACTFFDRDSNNVLFVANRDGNLYKFSCDDFSHATCLTSMHDDAFLWHRRLGHASFDLLAKLSSNNLVVGLPFMKSAKLQFCDACKLGKQHRTSFKPKNVVSTSRPLQLLHMDLFGPVDVVSLGGAQFVYVIVDDYSRFTWTRLLAHKYDAFNVFAKLCKRIQNEKGYTITCIRSDRGGEFRNSEFSAYCDDHGIDHNLSAPRTPQQNGVAERKNRTLQEMTRTMLNEHKLPQYFWGEAIQTACYMLNRVLLRPILKKTPYELWKGRAPNISYFKVFGCKCYILNTKDQLGKFEAKSSEGIFLGYSLVSKAYKVFNKSSRCVEESLHVEFDETDPFKPRKEVNLSDDEQEEESSQFDNPVEIELADEHRNPAGQNNHIDLPKAFKHLKDHPSENIIGDISKGVRTRGNINLCAYYAFISQFEPKNIEEALSDDEWIISMQKELDQFERNNVWELVERPSNHPVIGTKWVFRNKLDENGEIITNKSRLVAKGYNQVEGLDYEETFAPVARLESIRMLLAYACYMDFKLFQMDVKSAFLNGILKEEAYVEQPPGFENINFPNHVYKLNKALYGLKQAPRAWYERLSKYLLENGFSKGQIDSTLFVRTKGNDIMLVQVYVDDIIFGSTNLALCEEFSKVMTSEFEMSMMGELTYFLGLQIKQTKEGTFVSQAKYAKELVKKFNLQDGRNFETPMSTSIKIDKDEDGKPSDEKVYRGMIGSLLYLTASRPDIMYAVCVCARYQSCPKESHLVAIKRIIRYVKSTTNLGLWYPKGSNFSLVGYSDADYAGCTVDRKSTSGTCQFLGHSLVSWSSKKQNSVAISTAEAEYVALGSCVAQILWMVQALNDYNLKFSNVPIYCDNTSAINISKNPVLHSRTKHIEIRHHFIRDHVQKGNISVEYVDTMYQLADIFTKPLDTARFCFLRRELGMLELN